MGTRADFYVGRGGSAEWLGSIAWDGYPDGIDDSILKCKSEAEYRTAVEKFIGGRDDGTKPEQGWPWPWDTSSTTDYSYAFDGKVWAAPYGYFWFDPIKDEPSEDDHPELFASKDCSFPNMSERKNLTLGERSGVMVFKNR